MIKNKILNLLGIASRARKLIFGSDSVEKGLQDKKVTCVIVTSDSSLNTKNKFKKKCYFYKVPLILLSDSLEIGKAVGKKEAKVIGLCDQGFYESLEKLLKDGDSYES